MSDHYLGNDLTEIIKEMAGRQSGQRMLTCEGVITSVDQQKYVAKVMLMPWEIETGWLPIGSIAAGDGWGFFHVPPDGTLVTVDFLDGDIHSGRIRSCYTNDSTDKPPEGLVQGEFLLKHASGSLLRFTKDGDVVLTAARDLVVNAARDVTLTAEGDVTASVAGALAVTAEGAVNVTGEAVTVEAASGDVLIDGGNITLDGDVTLSQAGGSVTINGDLTATVDSLTATVAGAAEIEAASVSVVSAGGISVDGGSVSVSGGVVNIHGSAQTIIDGQDFMFHVHSGVTPGVGTSGGVY